MCESQGANPIGKALVNCNKSLDILDFYLGPFPCFTSALANILLKTAEKIHKP